jgi:glutaredoxin
VSNLERPTLLFFTRDGCHLCKEARQTLQGVLEERAASSRPVPAVREIDIDRDLEAGRNYLETIPVLVLNGRELHLASSAQSMRDLLDRALHTALV